MNIPVQKLNENAKVPTYAHPGDAGMDFYALEKTVIAPGERARIGTGIAIAIPKGFVGLVWDKSGLAFKHGITLLAGVVDSGYRGEIQMVVLNTGSEPHTFEAGDKVAQVLIQPIEHPEVREVTELNDTERGEDGFGSTGVA